MRGMLRTATWACALGAWSLVGVAAVGPASPAAAQAAGCVATGSGTSWVLHEPGAGSPSAGIAVGAPGGVTVADLSVTGWTGRLGTSGLPAGTSLEFFGNSKYLAQRAFAVKVTTKAPVTSGAFTSYLINATQSGYLPRVSCPIQISVAETTTTTSSTLPSLVPLRPQYVSSSDDLQWLWWGLTGLGGVLVLSFFAIHTGRKGLFGWGPCDDDDDDDDDDGPNGCSPCRWFDRMVSGDDDDDSDGCTPPRWFDRIRLRTPDDRMRLRARDDGPG